MPVPTYNSATPDDRTTIICLHCRKPQEVSRRALTITCRFCSRSLRLEDLVVKEYQARRVVETCGIVTVERKGQIVADRIVCGGMVIRGKVKGTILSRGNVLIGPEAEVRGELIAPAIAVQSGAIMEGRLRVGIGADLT